MKDALHYLDTIKIYVPEFGLDFDSGNDGCSDIAAGHEQ